MAAYYVLGILLVVWGLGLALFGLTREDFPPSGPAGRAVVGTTVVLVAGTLVALLASTHKEHPREEAAAKAAEAKAKPAAGAPEQPSPPGGAAPSAGGKTVKVAEKEFSITLASGNKLKAGQYTFAVQNTGKIQHDLAIEGGKLKETKTPLINAGQGNALKVSLEPGKYKFFCTVPGHEQSGMKVEVTVTGKAAKPSKSPKPPKPTKRAKPKARPTLPAAKTVPVTEKEFSIALAGGNALKAGKYAFAVKNTGKIQHDLAIEGGGLKETKTPLLSAGKQKDLKVELKPGKYKFFCTVPGHEQAGMKVDVTVK